MNRIGQALRPASLVFLIALSTLVTAFALKQRAAESSCPVHRDFTRQGEPENRAGLAYAITQAPGLSAYHVLLGRQYVDEAASPGLEEGELGVLLQKARDEFAMALYLEPSYTEALSYLARVRLSLGETAGGIRDLETAIEIDPGNYFNRINYGICILQFLDAIPDPVRESFIYRSVEELRRGIELNPAIESHPSVTGAISGLHLSRGDIGSAIEAIKGVRGSPKMKLPLLLTLAELYLKAGNESEGIAQYRRLLESRDYDAEDREKIAASLKGAASKYPSSSLSLMLAGVLMKDGDFKGAIDTLEGLQAQEPLAEAHFLKGVAYENLGELAGAYEEYRKAVGISPNHPEAASRLRDLYRRAIRRQGAR